MMHLVQERCFQLFAQLHPFKIGFQSAPSPPRPLIAIDDVNRFEQWQSAVFELKLLP